MKTRRSESDEGSDTNWTLRLRFERACENITTAFLAFLGLFGR